MVATVIVGILCAHLLCFSVMFLLISKRLQGNNMGMDVFALGNLLLGTAYVLQLLDGQTTWNVTSLVNHTLTLCSPVAYSIGAMRFFGKPVPLWRPLLILALIYSAAQCLVQWSLGTVARVAMLSGMSAAIFLAMTFTTVYSVRTFAKDLQLEMMLFATLISGLCVLNAVKFESLLSQGMQALDMNSSFQMAFYIYMSFMATVLAPTIVWLVLYRLTDDLRAMADRDPLTKLLNRRGLTEGLQGHFRSRNATPAHLLVLDIDYFKRVNDTHGHKAGDVVLVQVAKVISSTVRQGDLACRIGGEEFAVLCLDSDAAGALRLAERIRAAFEGLDIVVSGLPQAIQCTVTIGVSHSFTDAQGLDLAMLQADAALYRGKDAGRNRVEQASHTTGVRPSGGTQPVVATDKVAEPARAQAATSV
jgi:diguanylate cyclase (GGDEF)-like protein